MWQLEFAKIKIKTEITACPLDCFRPRTWQDFSIVASCLLAVLWYSHITFEINIALLSLTTLLG